MVRLILTILLLACVLPGLGQLTIGGASTIRVDGKMMVKGSVNNLSMNAQLATAEVSITGGDQTLTTTSPVEVQTLRVDGGGIKTLQGEWNITSSLLLTNGRIRVPSGGKLTYRGSENLVGTTTSYIEGLLHIEGTGQLIFPIGTSATYTPATLQNFGGGEIGIAAVAGDAGLILPSGIDSYFTGHYWLATQPPNSPVSLSLNGLTTFLETSEPIVVEAPSTGSNAASLSGNVSTDFVTSAQNASQPVLAIARSGEFVLIIHDLITPFTADLTNDKLHIEKIELTTTNKVKLLDRWGLLVAEWTDFRNDVDYDFQKFSPGNYVCIVEYTVPGSTKMNTVKGLVTILKSN